MELTRISGWRRCCGLVAYSINEASTRFAQEDPDVAMERKRADLDFQAHIDSFYGKSKRKKDNSKQPIKPARLVSEPREDREASASPPTGFRPDMPVAAKRMDGRGPYASRSLSEKAMDKAMERAAEEGANEPLVRAPEASDPATGGDAPSPDVSKADMQDAPDGKPKRKVRFLK